MNVRKTPVLLLILSAIHILSATDGFAQAVTPKPTVLPIFQTNVTVNTYQYPAGRGRSPVTFVVLHHDEQTGLKATKSVLERRGGKLVELASTDPITNKPSRKVYFKFNEKTLCFDPNRIFSDEGISKTLEGCHTAVPNGTDKESIIAAVKAFRKALLEIMMPKRRCWIDSTQPRSCPEEIIAAVHNSTDSSTDLTGEKSISALSFVVPGGMETDDTEAAYIVNGEDSDNFFIASNPFIFSNLINWRPKEEHFTVSLQKKRPISREGYLSVYSGMGNMNYIAIEAQHNTGNMRQTQMINRVLDAFDARRIR